MKTWVTTIVSAPTCVSLTQLPSVRKRLLFLVSSQTREKAQHAIEHDLLFSGLIGGTGWAQSNRFVSSVKGRLFLPSCLMVLETVGTMIDT